MKFKVRCLFFLTLVLGQVFPLHGEDSADSAEASVLHRLSENGIKIGVDADAGHYTFIGTCNRILPNPASERSFPKIRRECAEVAELTAKRDILCAVHMRVNARDEVAFQSDAKGSSRTTTSTLEILSKEPLSGASVIASAESWDAATGRYQVAVAVAWTKKLVAAAVDSVSPEGPDSRETDQSEWDRWLKTIDLSVVLGMHQFVDSQGRRRFAGIGCADVEGKTGASLLAARTVAETEAKASLALGLYGDSEMRSIATSTMRETESSDGTFSSDAWETFAGKVRARCRNKFLLGRVICTETIVHPVTGRHVLVCVYGMTAVEQAEANRRNNLIQTSQK